MSNELKSLSEKELEIVKLIANECLSNKALANRIHTTPKNIEKIKSGMYAKLGLHTATALVRFACVNNLIEK